MYIDFVAYEEFTHSLVSQNGRNMYNV